MKFHIYKDAKNEFRRRLQGNNNRIIADSGEGYKSKQHCREAIELAQASFNAEIIDDTPHREHIPREMGSEQVFWGS